MSTVYQHGTLALLMAGQYNGTQSYSKMLEHGNYGIGTTEGLGYEVIIIDGEIFGIDANGKVTLLNAENESSPFATVHHFDSKINSNKINNKTLDDLSNLFIQDNNLENVFAAITIKGTFKSIKARAVEKQAEPYPDFLSVTKTQAIFEAENITGTLTGYWSPAMYNGTTAAGWHAHFIDDKRKFGGHVLDLEVDNAEYQLEIFDDYVLHLPIENQTFTQSHIDFAKLAKEIAEAEK